MTTKDWERIDNLLSIYCKNECKQIAECSECGYVKMMDRLRKDIKD
jgi:hypothetical protein